VYRLKSILNTSLYKEYIYRVSLSMSSRTCEEVERSKLNKEILFHVTIFVIIIEILIIEIERMREALDRSSYSTAYRVRHCLPALRYPWLPLSPFSRFTASRKGSPLASHARAVERSSASLIRFNN